MRRNYKTNRGSRKTTVRSMKGGKRHSRSSKKKTKSKRRQRRRISKGGAIRLPSEFFGKNSGRYFDKPNSSYNTAYGPSRGVSHGTIGATFTGPNLAPGPNSSSMTGGNRRRRSKRTRRLRTTKRK